MRLRASLRQLGLGRANHTTSPPHPRAGRPRRLLQRLLGRRRQRPHDGGPHREHQQAHGRRDRRQDRVRKVVVADLPVLPPGGRQGRQVAQLPVARRAAGQRSHLRDRHQRPERQGCDAEADGSDRSADRRRDCVHEGDVQVSRTRGDAGPGGDPASSIVPWLAGTPSHRGLEARGFEAAFTRAPLHRCPHVAEPEAGAAARRAPP